MNDRESTPKLEASKRFEKYLVRYQNNSSKRWDNKEIWLDAEWLEELYSPSQLVPGFEVKLPWASKGGKISYWNAVVADPQLCTAKENCKYIQCKHTLANFTF